MDCSPFCLLSPLSPPPHHPCVSMWTQWAAAPGDGGAPAGTGARALERDQSLSGIYQLKRRMMFCMIGGANGAEELMFGIDILCDWFDVWISVCGRSGVFVL